MLAGTTLAVLVAVGGCALKPREPDLKIACTSDDQCPPGSSCRPSSIRTPEDMVCCSGELCLPKRALADAAAPPRDARAPSSRPDAGASPGPDAQSNDSSPPAPADAAAPRRDGGVTPNIVCSSNIHTPLPPMAGQNVYCTVEVGDRYVFLGIDAITMDDPVSTRAYAVCNAKLALAAETTDAKGNAAALSSASLDALVDTVARYQQICAEQAGRMVGAVARAWARVATNQAEVASHFKEATGLALDIPTPDEELVQRYYGAARYRRGRLVLTADREQAELITWPARAPAPVLTAIPTRFADAGPMFFANASYQSFEDARRALRAKLGADSAAPLAELAAQVKQGALSPLVSVAPTDPLVPLALAGQLRTAGGSWFEPALWQAASAAATVSPSPYGRVFGVVLPAELDRFFLGLDAAQFAQLRSNPIASAYGARLMYMVTLLDLLADEGKATEFGFAFTNPDFGFLFVKLFPSSR